MKKSGLDSLYATAAKPTLGATQLVLFPGRQADQAEINYAWSWTSNPHTSGA
jgi:hypothetical protein